MKTNSRKWGEELSSILFDGTIYQQSAISLNCVRNGGLRSLNSACSKRPPNATEAGCVFFLLSIELRAYEVTLRVAQEKRVSFLQELFSLKNVNEILLTHFKKKKNENVKKA